VNRHLLGAVERLAAAGLRRFLVPSELPWGFSPIQLPGVGEAERRGLNALIARQNAALQEALQDLAARRGLVVVQPDFHALFLEVRADPPAYGFTEIGRPVLVLDPGVAAVEAEQAAVTPADAAGHLWWDSWAHFTTALHALLAAEALKELHSLGASQ
jgi:outer membrane lipase/esterase